MQSAASIELGPYQLLERIGEGGSGQIYRATGPAGLVAIKLLGPASDLDEAARARFARELATLGQIKHANLVALLDHGFDDELGPYLVLELLAGADLRAVCAGRALCPEAALLLIRPIVAATVALHAAGFVHRDLKPENAIAGPDGAITVIDLGLAWREGMTRHTDTGAAVGSVGYMAPEQIEGRPVEAAADVWALGVMIHELVTGKRPFARARPAEEAAAVLVGTCARLDAADRRCEPALADLVARCLATAPAARPTAATLLAALDEMIDWTEDADAERAAAVADPPAYQQRVASFRVRRLERLAREAVTAGKPFAAIALCDRGLAYAPDHPALLALVASAEAATAAPPAPPAKRSYAWLAIAALGLAGGIAIAYLLVPERKRHVDVAVATGSATEGDKELLHDFVGLLGTAMASRDDSPAAPAGEQPTTARGWLRLASKQPPVEAVASIRRALALNPGWAEAQGALCVALAAAKDPGALPPCDTAVRARPGDTAVLAARGSARVHAGQFADALLDLDRVVAADPDPRWRRLRAQAREGAGDRAGAQRDLTDACQLGDAVACQLTSK